MTEVQKAIEREAIRVIALSTYDMLRWVKFKCEGQYADEVEACLSAIAALTAKVVRPGRTKDKALKAAVRV